MSESIGEWIERTRNEEEEREENKKNRVELFHDSRHDQADLLTLWRCFFFVYSTPASTKCLNEAITSDQRRHLKQRGLNYWIVVVNVFNGALNNAILLCHSMDSAVERVELAETNVEEAADDESVHPKPLFMSVRFVSIVIRILLFFFFFYISAGFTVWLWSSQLRHWLP